MSNELTDHLSFKPVVVGYEDWPKGLDQMILWCENNTVGRYSYGLHHGGPDGSIVYAFYFEKENDYVPFALTWGLN